MIQYLLFDTSKLLNISDITKRIGNFFKLPIQLFHGVPYPELALLGRPTPIDYRSVITPNVQPAQFLPDRDITKIAE